MNPHADSSRLASLLGDQRQQVSWLGRCGVSDIAKGLRNLETLLGTGISDDLQSELISQLEEALPSVTDADMAINNLERFFTSVRSPLTWAASFSRDVAMLPAMLQMFSMSQHISDAMIRQPSVFDTIWQSQGAPVSRELLVDDAYGCLATAHDEQQAAVFLNQFKHHHIARIAYGDIVRGQMLEVVTRQISYLADAITTAAFRWNRQRLTANYGQPCLANGLECQAVVLALGKLGGLELNYSSDIDLVVFFAEEGTTDGQRQISNTEFFSRVVRSTIRVLTQQTILGSAYRVDMRLRPEGAQGPLTVPLPTALKYYDSKGRAWERQAFIKARPIAGDLELGESLLKRLEPWVYRHHLRPADVQEIKALKRKIEKHARREGADQRDVKIGHGGIRDIEFVIQFLQLLLGAEQPVVRTSGTLEAITRLEQASGLSMQERTLLERNYVFLRKIEHRLQIMFDTQTHSMPARPDELTKMARRMGFFDDDNHSALEKFQSKYNRITSLNRRILDHILHSAGDDDQISPIAELILSPDPAESEVHSALKSANFEDPLAAYRNLDSLAKESIPFLSGRRCRHFLATIAPQLVEEIGRTPDADQALITLSQVSDAIGGKGTLWELFNNSAPSMRLYVRLCAGCPYLAEILTSHPGMLDELLDSLLLDKLPSRESLFNLLNDLCGQAEDIDPILISFKNTQHLRVGVRDILGKESIRNTTAALADIAEVSLQRLVAHNLSKLQQRFGTPTTKSGDAECEFVTIAVGKFGGREPNYHSDLDVLFLFEEEGQTAVSSDQQESTTNQHFFGELGQRIIRAATRSGPTGSLYPIDARLRPTGRSGPLATSFAEFERYFLSGQGQLWERLALCKSRPVTGSPAVRQCIQQRIHHVITHPTWSLDDAHAVYDMRLQLEQGATPRNLKRGPGGTVDIEFLLQGFQLRYGAKYPDIMEPGVWKSIEALNRHQLLTDDDAQYLARAYRFLRNVEAHLRLMNTMARHDFPTDEKEVTKLAYLLEVEDPQMLWQEAQEIMQKNRQVFLRLLELNP